MQITIEIEFEQGGWIVRGTARVRTARLGKAQCVQIERGDKRIQKAHRVFSHDIIVERFREEQCLRAIQTRAMIHA